jgi:hypothetical protein
MEPGYPKYVSAVEFNPEAISQMIRFQSNSPIGFQAKLQVLPTGIFTGELIPTGRPPGIESLLDLASDWKRRDTK